MPSIIDAKVASDLSTGRIWHAHPQQPYICSPLGLVPKSDGGWRRIHHLSFPNSRLVNDSIPQEFGEIEYTTFDAITNDIVITGRGIVILKRDIKDAFWIVLIAQLDQHLLGFTWDGQYYAERALVFGLRTAPMLFNLFAEALHWILLSKIQFAKIHHYLDDFIFLLRKLEAKQCLTHLEADYQALTDDLGIPRKDSKDACGTTATVLGIEVDTI